MFRLSGILLVALAVPASLAGHELTVPESDAADAERVPVDHEHMCVPFVVSHLPRQLGGGMQEVGTVIHRRQWKPPEEAQYAAINAAWIALHPTTKQTSPPTNETNCHGLTFDEGRSWIPEPDAFLSRCRTVESGKEQVGDVVIYKAGNSIEHSGRIKEIQGEVAARRIIVHSQWGGAGDLDHPIDELPQGETIEFVYPPGSPPRKATLPNYGKPTVYRCP